MKIDHSLYATGWEEVRELKAIKRRARARLAYAVHVGRIKKPANCQRCATPKAKEELQGHHWDYSRPLVVWWLCAACHGAMHPVPGGQ